MNVQIIENNIQLQFSYDPETISLVKMAPGGRKYRPSDKSWILPVNIDNLRYLIQNNIGNGECHDLLEKLEAPLSIEDDIKVFWPVQPFEHQIYSLKLLLSNNGLGLFLEQGLGKTLIAIIGSGERFRRGKIQSLLVLCPKTVLSAWEREFEQYSKLTPVVIKGSAKKREQLLRENNICLMNYDLLIPMEKALIERSFDMIIFDESHFLKNNQSRRSKIAYKISRNTLYRLLMTGTPVGKDPSDLFSQFRIIDETIFGTSFMSFRSRYFINVGYGNIPNWKLRDDMITEINRKRSLRSYRLLKTDALDLPDKLYQFQTVEMTPEQKKHYREVERDLFTEIQGEEIEIRYIITKLIRLNQICSGFLQQDGSIFRIPHNKITALREIVNHYDGKIVIFSLFLNDLTEIQEAFPGTHIINGSKSTEERKEAIRRFQDDPDSKIIALQIQTGSTGITLTSAHLCIFYSQTYNLIDRIQAEDRLHRIGQKNPVTYIDLITENSIELDIIDSIQNKKTMAQAIQGDLVKTVLDKFKTGMACKK